MFELVYYCTSTCLRKSPLSSRSVFELVYYCTSTCLRKSPLSSRSVFELVYYCTSTCLRKSPLSSRSVFELVYYCTSTCLRKSPLSSRSVFELVYYSSQNTSPEDYRLIARNPKDCNPSSCDIFIGIQTSQVGNTSFLEIYMEAEADGWVALGVSNSASMVTMTDPK